MLVAVIILCSLALASAQSTDEAIQCPFPGGPDPGNEVQCSVYSACTWTGTACRMGDNAVAGYKAISDPEDTGRGYQIYLQKIDEASTLFEGDILQPVFEVIYHEDYHVQIKISDSQNSRYEVPLPLDLPVSAGLSPMYTVTTSNVGEPFTFSVTRNSNGGSVFELQGPLTFANQFIQLTTKLSGEFLYGLGENYHNTFKHDFATRKTYGIFPRDQPVSYDNNGEVNSYGYQPYYVNVEDAEGNTHSVLFYGSNAMEYTTFSLSDGSPALTLKTIGGIVDLHFFLGPMPEDVNMQYAQTVGYPNFPPYFALGFHLSRYGYNSADNVRTVYDRNRAMEIPQDVQTFDIDYMERYKDFSYDKVAYAGLPQLISDLHDDGLKVTILLDPAIVADFSGDYPTASNGKDLDVFIKWYDPFLVPSDQPADALDYVLGYVWPDNKTVFPDFLKPETTDWWTTELETFHQTIDYDVIWIDMNEPANFGTNEDKPFNYPPELPDWSLKCPFNEFDDPPYPTVVTYMDINNEHRISDKTICMSSQQTDGTNLFMHYDVHSLYGITESIATYNGLQAVFPGKRNLILSRSTFVGSGKYITHWLGDNYATWDQLKYSIVGMLEFNLFAIPNVGADICGFNGVPDDELCTRWMELGAFYPFSRNHNTIGVADQDPAAPRFNTTGPASKNALNLRYKYLPFMYEVFHMSHMYGNSVIRPLWNAYPTDLNARFVDDQFLWGSQMMVAPVVDQGVSQRDVYFPESAWYDIVTGLPTSAEGTTETLTIQAPLEEIPVFVRGGSVLPFQEPDLTTSSSRLNPFGLLVALDSSGNAVGEVFWDDGESMMNMTQSFQATVTVTSTHSLAMTTRGSPASTVGILLESVVFYGFTDGCLPSDVTVNGDPPSFYSFNPDLSTLEVHFSVPLGQDLTLEMIPGC